MGHGGREGGREGGRVFTSQMQHMQGTPGVLIPSFPSLFPAAVTGKMRDEEGDGCAVVLQRHTHHT